MRPRPRFQRAYGFFCGCFFIFNALVSGCILVAKKQVSYCRCSKSKDKATVKIACYFDSSHIISIIDTAYLYIFILTNGVQILYFQISPHTQRHTHMHFVRKASTHLAMSIQGPHTCTHAHTPPSPNMEAPVKVNTNVLALVTCLQHWKYFYGRD